jgi:hypothetical protein
MEQRLFGGRAQHQHFAAEVFKVPDVLIQALGQHVVAGDADALPDQSPDRSDGRR